MTTTEMRVEDIRSVSELLCDSYRLLASREGLTPEQTEFLVRERGSTDCVRRESQSECYLVARDQDRIVGMVSVSGETITKLYVSPNRIGEGIGRSLYDAGEAAIRADGHGRVSLGAFPSAAAFYARMGLSAVGQKPATGALAGLSIVLMEKRLAPEAA